MQEDVFSRILTAACDGCLVSAWTTRGMLDECRALDKSLFLFFGAFFLAEPVACGSSWGQGSNSSHSHNARSLPARPLGNSPGACFTRRPLQTRAWQRMVKFLVSVEPRTLKSGAAPLLFRVLRWTLQFSHPRSLPTSQGPLRSGETLLGAAGRLHVLPLLCFLQ